MIGVAFVRTVLACSHGDNADALHKGVTSLYMWIIRVHPATPCARIWGAHCNDAEHDEREARGKPEDGHGLRSLKSLLYKKLPPRAGGSPPRIVARGEEGHGPAGKQNICAERPAQLLDLPGDEPHRVFLCSRGGAGFTVSGLGEEPAPAGFLHRLFLPIEPQGRGSPPAGCGTGGAALPGLSHRIGPPSPGSEVRQTIFQNAFGLPRPSFLRPRSEARQTKKVKKK